MFNASLNQTGYPIELFDLLKQHASFNLIYLDVHDHDWVCKHANYLLENKAFDKVFSVDPRDAEQYGLVLCHIPGWFSRRAQKRIRSCIFAVPKPEG